MQPIRRVLVLTPGFAPTDGVSVIARLVAGAVSPGPREERRVEVRSLTTEGGEDARGLGAAFRSSGGSRLRFATGGLAAALAPGAAETLVVVLHVHLLPVALPLLLRGARLAVFLHGIEAWRPLSWLQAWTLRRASRVLAVSAHTAARFREANPGLADLEIAVCHHGIEPLPAPPPGKDEGFALIVGRMAAAERYKGHDLLLDLWPRLREAVPGARLVVAGDGDDRPRLEARARELGLGLAGAVTFTGRVSAEDLAGLYERASFFVMPSRHEGFGLVFLEAMRAGKAVLAGVGAAAEVVEHGETGLVVDPDRPEEVLAALVRLFQEPEIRRRMGEAGAARFGRLFTAARFGERFRELVGLGQMSDTDVETPQSL